MLSTLRGSSMEQPQQRHVTRASKLPKSDVAVYKSGRISPPEQRTKTSA